LVFQKAWELSVGMAFESCDPAIGNNGIGQKRPFDGLDSRNASISLCRKRFSFSASESFVSTATNTAELRAASSISSLYPSELPIPTGEINLQTFRRAQQRAVPKILFESLRPRFASMG
jgi:hypothetical protein